MAGTVAVNVAGASTPGGAGRTARPKVMPDGVLGMVVFVFTEIMLFAGLITAHTIVRMGAAAGAMWPPYGQPPLPWQETALNTSALLASGVALLLAQVEWRRHGLRPMVSMLVGGATVLGALFVVMQGREWAVLIAEGLTMTSSTYGALFYLIVGAHGLHAVAAIVALAWGWYRLHRSSLNRGQLASIAVFWYFVVLVWPILYWRVYF